MCECVYTEPLSNVAKASCGIRTSYESAFDSDWDVIYIRKEMGRIQDVKVTLIVLVFWYSGLLILKCSSLVLFTAARLLHALGILLSLHDLHMTTSPHSQHIPTRRPHPPLRPPSLHPLNINIRPPHIPPFPHSPHSSHSSIIHTVPTP